HERRPDDCDGELTRAHPEIREGHGQHGPSLATIAAARTANRDESSLSRQFWARACQGVDDKSPRERPDRSESHASTSASSAAFAVPSIVECSTELRASLARSAAE